MEGKIDYVKQGKRNRRKGTDFEAKVRKDLEETGYTVTRWNNQINLETEEIVPAKITRFHKNTTGFPDFVAFEKLGRTTPGIRTYKIYFVECKFNGILSKIEKQKMNILKKMGHYCFTAYNENGKVRYREFVEYKESSGVRGKKAGD